MDNGGTGWWMQFTKMMEVVGNNGGTMTKVAMEHEGESGCGR